MPDQPPYTPTERFNENQRTALIYAYGKQVERTYRSVSHIEDEAQLDQEAHSVRVKAVGRVSQWFDDQIAAAEQRGAIKALQDAANLSRTCWAANKNLIDPNDPEVSYSFDKWLEVHADRLEGNDE